MRRFALFALVLAVAGLVWFLVGGDPSIERGPSSDAPIVEAAPTVGDAALAATQADTRTDVAVEASAAVPVEDAALTTTTGPSFRVVDPQGVPLVGVEIALAKGVTLTSDGAGLVAGDIERIAMEPRLGATHVLLATGHGRLPGFERGPLAIVAPARTVHVRVVDTSGSPVPDAEVLARRQNPLAHFPVPVDLSYVAQETDAERHDRDGATHRFVALRSDRPPTVQASHESRRGVVRVDALEDAPLVIVLEPIPVDDMTRITIRGTVFASPGVPAVGARVFVDDPDYAVETDAAGLFELAYGVRGQPIDHRALGDTTAIPERLIARHSDFGLAYVDDFEAAVVEYWPSDPPPFEIVLPGANGALRGRLVDASGDGLDGWSVGVYDPTPIGSNLSSNGMMESRATRTDQDGRFVLAMVDPTREYSLAFTEPETRVTFRAGPFAPGPHEHVVAADGTAFVFDVRGVLRGLSGEPLADVELKLAVDTYLMTANGGYTSSGESFGATTTDAAGRFTFERVPRHGANVEIASNSERRFDTAPLWIDPTAVPIELVATRLVPIVPVVDESFAREARLVALDAAGERLDFRAFPAAGSTMSTDALPLSNLDASVRWVSESTVEFALCVRDATTREEITIARVPLPRWSGSAAEPVRVEFAR
jgi:hypothetical protein